MWMVVASLQACHILTVMVWTECWRELHQGNGQDRWCSLTTAMWKWPLPHESGLSERWSQPTTIIHLVANGSSPNTWCPTTTTTDQQRSTTTNRLEYSHKIKSFTTNNTITNTYCLSLYRLDLPSRRCNGGYTIWGQY